MRKKTIATIVVAVTTLVIAGTAVAGKPSSSLSLVMLSDGASTSTATRAADPTYGSQITFEVSTTETDRPFVNVRCYQGSAFVHDGWHGFFDSYSAEPVFTLSSAYWAGGAADCTATLGMWNPRGRFRELASTSFHVVA